MFQVTICFYPAKSTCTDTNVRITCLDSKVLHFHLSSEHFSIIQPFQMPFAVGVGSLKRKGDVLVCTSQERL